MNKSSGETLKSCTMIIAEPNEFVAEVHDRMPVLLAEKDYEPWLSASAGQDMRKPGPRIWTTPESAWSSSAAARPL